MQVARIRRRRGSEKPFVADTGLNLVGPILRVVVGPSEIGSAWRSGLSLCRLSRVTVSNLKTLAGRY